MKELCRPCLRWGMNLEFVHPPELVFSRSVGGQSKIKNQLWLGLLRSAGVTADTQVHES